MVPVVHAQVVASEVLEAVRLRGGVHRIVEHHRVCVRSQPRAEKGVEHRNVERRVVTNDRPRRKHLCEMLFVAQVHRYQHDRLIAAVPDTDAEQFEVGTGAVDVSARLDVYDDVVAQSVQFGHRFDHTGLLGGRQGNRTRSNLEAAYEQTEAVCGHGEYLGGRHEVADQPCAEAEHSCVGLVNLLELHLSIPECVALSALEHVYERRRELRLGVVSNLHRSSLVLVHRVHVPDEQDPSDKDDNSSEHVQTSTSIQRITSRPMMPRMNHSITPPPRLP